MLHYTGRFKMKKLVQARILRKHNSDSHYANAIYSFLRKRASKHVECVAFASVDAKCKVQVGEPDFPIASVMHGKAVIVGSNQTFKVGDHDFSKFSLIPDVILLHDVPRSGEDDAYTDEEEGEYVKTSLGSWYRGTTAWRGVAELYEPLKGYYQTVPQRVYIYADGGGDRRITFLRVQMALIAMFLSLDLDELISARPAAGHSFRNPGERCHAIANLGLQNVGMMRQRMGPEDENIMKNLNNTEEIRKACQAILD